MQPYRLTTHGSSQPTGAAAVVLGSGGYFLILDAEVSPSGVGETVTAQQVSGGTNTATLTYNPSPPAWPNDYYYSTSFNAGLTGQWQVTAVNGGESATKLTSTLDDIRLLPLATTFSVSTSSGEMTPTVSWTGFDPALYPEIQRNPCERFGQFLVRVRARLASTGKVVWDSSGHMPTSITSYTFPAGVLEPGQDYLLAVLLNHLDYESGVWGYENRSETFLQYSTPVPIPGALWLLGSGLIGLIGIRRFGK